MSSGERPIRSQPSADDVLRWIALLVLTVLIIILLVQVHSLRRDVSALSAREQTPSAAASGTTNLIEVCGLLGALAKANGVKPAEVFRDNALQGDCEAAAVSAATP